MQTPGRPSFALRAAAAVGLMAGFYLLVLAVLAVLAGIAWADLVWARRLDLRILAACAIGIFAVLRGTLFLGDRFEPPGPEITAEEQPRLFATIRAVARKMGARLPQHVYLVPDVNAFVAEVGGFMGIAGTRRVMGIGVGILNTDTVAQLEATIAHEFGHFQGGDTRLGGFLYRTRASIHRVVLGLGEDAFLAIPFKAYHALFMKLTQALSRQQELAADGYSVQVAGKAAHVEGLRREAVGATLFQSFLGSEVEPLLEEKCRPANLFEGYRAYVDNLGEDGALERLEVALDAQPTDPWDSHPSLRDRLAAAALLPETPVAPGGDALSRTLLVDPDATERAMTDRMLADIRWDDGSQPRVVAWSELGSTVYAARFEKNGRELDRFLPPGAGVSAVLELVETRDFLDLARRLVKPTEREQASEADLRRYAGTLIQARLAVEVARAHPQLRWDTVPGRSVRLVLPDGSAFDAAALVRSVAEDPAQKGAVRAELERLGLLPAAALAGESPVQRPPGPSVG